MPQEDDEYLTQEQLDKKWKRGIPQEKFSPTSKTASTEKKVEKLQGPGAIERFMKSATGGTSILEPTSGAPFESAEGPVGKFVTGMGQTVSQSGENTKNFIQAMMRGDTHAAAFYLPGIIPQLGPGSQIISKDLENGDIPSALGHTVNLLTNVATLQPMIEGGPGLASTTMKEAPRAVAQGVRETPQTAAETVRAIPGAAREGGNIARDIAVGGARDVASTAANIDLRRPFSMIKTDPLAAIGTVPGAIAGHHFGGYPGAAAGAFAGGAIPSFARGAYRTYKAGREARAAGPIRYEQFPETPPLPPTEFEKFPQYQSEDLPPTQFEQFPQYQSTPLDPTKFEQFPQYQQEQLPPTQFVPQEELTYPPQERIPFIPQEEFQPWKPSVSNLRGQSLVDALRRIVQRKAGK